MPIYEYACRSWGEQFELLVLSTPTPACPSCEGHDLERLRSGFAVSSAGMRQANIASTRKTLAASSSLRDQKVAESQEIKEHLNDDYGVDFSRKPAPPGSK